MLFRRTIVTFVLTSLAFASVASLRAQDVMPKESAAVVKASFLADLETLRGKFVGLAEAFPQDKYTWRPMDGVRSVSEVLMLAAFEGYTFIPTSFGEKRPTSAAAKTRPSCARSPTRRRSSSTSTRASRTRRRSSRRSTRPRSPASAR